VLKATSNTKGEYTTIKTNAIRRPLSHHTPPITRGTFVLTANGEYSDLLREKFGFSQALHLPAKKQWHTARR